jgi:hypothetical protein
VAGRRGLVAERQHLCVGDAVRHAESAVRRAQRGAREQLRVAGGAGERRGGAQRRPRLGVLAGAGHRLGELDQQEPARRSAAAGERSSSASAWR